MKNAMKKIMSLLLVVFMLATIVPFAAFAFEDEIVWSDDEGASKAAIVTEDNAKTAGAAEAYGFIGEGTPIETPKPKVAYQFKSGSKILTQKYEAELDDLGAATINEIVEMHEDELEGYSFTGATIYKSNTFSGSARNVTSGDVQVTAGQSVIIYMGADTVKVAFTVESEDGTFSQTDELNVVVGTKLKDVYGAWAVKNTNYKVVKYEADGVPAPSGNQTVTTETRTIKVTVSSKVVGGNGSNNAGNGNSGNSGSNNGNNSNSNPGNSFNDFSDNQGWIDTGANNGSSNNGSNNGNNGTTLIPGGSTTLKPNGSTNSNGISSYHKAYLRIYLNGNDADTKPTVVELTSQLDDDVFSLTEAERIVNARFTAKDSSKKMTTYGLYVWENDWWSNGNNAGTASFSGIDDVLKSQDVVFSVMVMNAKAKSSTSSTNKSDNPKTGDPIIMTTTIMGLSASALACAYFLNKKKLAK